YPMADGNGEVVIATTRPETKLGQSALMVNPNDERFKHLIGREVRQPLVPDKPIKIIGDEHVNMEFGTGVVTVTPGHDPDDFEVAHRHNLPIIELITTEGKMSDNVPDQFRGMTVLEAREKVAEELAKQGFLRGVESYTHSVGKCYKCGTVIEPLALEQWFVNMETLKKPALAALEKKEITFYPDSKRRQLIRYLEGLKDWNISRQIAWGIPIPAFQNTQDVSDWIFDRRVDQETIEVNGQTYKRDPDVFDTWFSSSSWPYSTLNYPEGEEYKRFYPTSLMETAGEILHQWVARMIMLGLYTTGKIPFKDVYIHGLVLAEGGAKMSKSLGNVVNAMEVIAEHGSDALRMGLIAGRAAAVNRGYDRRRVGEARNFANKLWNVARYAEDKIGDQHSLRANAAPQSIADHWILNKLSISTNEMSKYLESYRLAEAYETLYHFVWDELADWYVEATKTEANPAFLAHILESTLKLAHPFAPFVAETIWQTLAWEQDNLLATQLWPQPSAADAAKAAHFEQVRAIVSEVRKISTTLGLDRPRLIYHGEHNELIAKLAGLSSVEAAERPSGLKLTSNDAWLDINPQVIQKYLLTLSRQNQIDQVFVERLEDRLTNQDYLSKAPKELVEQTKAEKDRYVALIKARNEEINKYEKSLEL
ncbi:MAG: class I tRNA ligase family protein, partial [Candidatus Saccharimonadales bacterium]